MKKRGFAMIMAMIFMVVIATIGVFTMNFAKKNVTKTTDNFVKEQAELLAVSAANYARMAMQLHDFSSSCLKDINISYPSSNKDKKIFDINVRLFYYNRGYVGKPGCTVISQTDLTNTALQNLALVDVKVKSVLKDAPVVYGLRTVQKP